MYEFHDDYIKNKYGSNSGLLFTDMKIVYENFGIDKKMFDFSRYSAKLNYMIIQAISNWKN